MTAFEREGFALLPGFVAGHELKPLRAAVEFHGTPRDLPLSRVANSETVLPSPFQKRRTESRYLPFHSVQSTGKLPTW